MKTNGIHVSILFLAAGLGLAVGCGEDESPAPGAHVAAVTDLGIVTTSETIQGRDGGYSAVFEGRSVWLYGDITIETEAADGRKWRHNSWSYTTDLDISDGLTGFKERNDIAGAPTEFFPQTDKEEAFNDVHFIDDCTEEPCGARWAIWPAQMVADDERFKALIFYHKIYAEPGDFNFERVGTSIAVWDNFEEPPERPVFNPEAEHPSLMFSKDEPSFGSAAVVVKEMMYVYACDLDWVVKPCRLARIPLVDALNRSYWEYWRGDGWGKDLAQAVSVFDGNDMMTVAWNPYLNAYLAVYSQPLDAKVMMRTSPSPEGPWSGEVKMFDAEKPEEGDWVYDALAHPEYQQDNGRIIYITYTRNTGSLQSEMRLVKVELER